MERRYTSINPEQDWELQVIVDDVVKREIDHHPDLNSRRKKLIFIQETFGWNTVEVAHILRVSEDEARRFLSRRGIRNNEFEQIEEQFNGTFAITSIIAAHVEGLLPRRDALVRPNALLEDLGIKEMLKKGEVNKAVAITEQSFKKFHEES